MIHIFVSNNDSLILRYIKPFKNPKGMYLEQVSIETQKPLRTAKITLPCLDAFTTLWITILPLRLNNDEFYRAGGYLMSWSAVKEIGSLPDGHQNAAGWRNKEVKAAVCQTASSNWLAVVFELSPRWRRLLEKGGARFCSPTALFRGNNPFIWWFLWRFPNLEQ